MAIEEKQRALEFTYVPNDMEGDLKYEISYDESKGMFPISINTGGSDISYPLELFTEVVEFLSSKGVIHPNILRGTVPSHGLPVSAMAAATPSVLLPPNAASIPVPQVVRGGALSSNMDPLASFDITSQTSIIPSSVGGTSPTPLAPTSAPPIPKIIKADADGIVMQSPPSIPFIPDTSASKISSEMTMRPVIRSRVTGGDPQSAEREAALLRASSGKGAGKTIRKAHRAEGE